MYTIEAPIAILMPTTEHGDYPRFRERYQGLSDELTNLAVKHFFTEGHDSYDDSTQTFSNTFDSKRHSLAPMAIASVVRDLTMVLQDRPLYTDPQAPLLVHNPETNRFIADKSALWEMLPEIHPKTHKVTHTSIANGLDAIQGGRVLIKPVTGQMSRGVGVYTKAEANALSLSPGSYLVQELIDTSGGMPEFAIEGVHNLRVISIASKAIGAVGRVGGSDPDILRDDCYGEFIEADQLPDGVQDIVDAVHDVLSDLPGDGNNVIAIDTMRGIGANGERRDFLCEVNRRPMRISPWDLHNPSNRDPLGIRLMSQLWDSAEAEMLAKVAQLPAQVSYA